MKEKDKRHRVQNNFFQSLSIQQFASNIVGSHADLKFCQIQLKKTEYHGNITYITNLWIVFSNYREQSIKYSIVVARNLDSYNYSTSKFQTIWINWIFLPLIFQSFSSFIVNDLPCHVTIFQTTFYSFYYNVTFGVTDSTTSSSSCM